MNKYPVISLFSGGLGMDLGLIQAGLDVRVSQDFDKNCVATIKHNVEHTVVPGDIKKLFEDDPSGSFLLDAAGLKRGEAFLVVGGPPCQSFSNAGKRLGLSDLRGTLFQEFAKAIDIARPRFFVMENVPTIGTKSMPGVLELMLEAFESLNYSVVYGVVDASEHGTPQARKRMIFIGSRDGEEISLPSASHGSIDQGLRPKMTVRDAIGDLITKPGPCAVFSEKTQKYIPLIPTGGNWRDLPANLQPIAMGKAYESGGGKTGFFRRLGWDGQSPTLVTSPVQKMSLLAHPTENRPLSVREYARIQGFPDNWEFQGALAAQYRQIGNAVAVPVGRAIGNHLIAIAGMKRMKEAA